YVSTVLPELGEENMQQTTFQEYTEHRLGHQFQLESPLTQMEYVLTAMQLPGYTERLEGIQFKSSALFMQAIDQYASHLKQAGILFSPITFRGKVLISSEHIHDIFYSYDTSLPIPNRMSLVAKALYGELKQLEIRERTKPWVEDEMELL
ncbi:helicase, partial [Bacillus sp. SIMBA_074]